MDIVSSYSSLSLFLALCTNFHNSSITGMCIASYHPLFAETQHTDEPFRVFAQISIAHAPSAGAGVLL